MGILFWCRARSAFEVVKVEDCTRDLIGIFDLISDNEYNARNLSLGSP